MVRSGFKHKPFSWRPSCQPLGHVVSLELRLGSPLGFGPNPESQALQGTVRACTVLSKSTEMEFASRQSTTFPLQSPALTRPFSHRPFDHSPARKARVCQASPPWHVLLPPTPPLSKSSLEPNHFPSHQIQRALPHSEISAQGPKSQTSILNFLLLQKAFQDHLGVISVSSLFPRH